ncbi:MAG TPA: tRNA (adenosine(37)-N6)-threonylcarbamoyltransferase complex dimerization subunit type 1 TsaB [Sphingobacteriaceae bacterium]|nr:tRNA (adenosine(37)-N6)-threonylcarbamoyltransferase complex dimerization subunit type 1 TsaB [Sphingobacteriaceae bacterium]
MALILQLETATTSCSVALSLDGKTIAFRELSERNAHASHITLFIREVLEKAGRTMDELEAVAVSVGPGSYTGLRIGVSTAKGLCFALNIPLIGIETLKTMTAGLISSGSHNTGNLYCPMIDARRMEVYTAVYNNQLNTVVDIQAKILDSDSFGDLLATNKIIFFGDGAFKCAGIFNNPNAIILTDFVNSAKDMSGLVLEKFKKQNFEDVAYFEPFYLKDFLVLKPKGL